MILGFAYIAKSIPIEPKKNARFSLNKITFLLKKMQNIIIANHAKGNLVIREIIKLVNKNKNNVKKFKDNLKPSYELNSCLCQLLYAI